VAVPRWEHFRHGADIGVRGLGPTPASAFEQTALALTAVIADPASIETNETVEISVTAPSLDILLYDWLNALILEMATRGMLFGAFDVTIDGLSLVGHARGEQVSRDRHQPAVEIKGATMTELSVAQVSPGLWQAQCVVDV
jgi:SHS2 domain-containing protein